MYCYNGYVQYTYANWTKSLLKHCSDIRTIVEDLLKPYINSSVECFYIASEPDDMRIKFTDVTIGYIISCILGAAIVCFGVIWCIILAVRKHRTVIKIGNENDNIEMTKAPV